MHSVKIAGMQNMWYADLLTAASVSLQAPALLFTKLFCWECWFRLWFPSLCLSTLFLCAKTLHWSLNCSMNNGLFTPRTETITIKYSFYENSEVHITAITITIQRHSFFQLMDNKNFDRLALKSLHIFKVADDKTAACTCNKQNYIVCLCGS